MNIKYVHIHDKTSPRDGCIHTNTRTDHNHY